MWQSYTNYLHTTKNTKTHTHTVEQSSCIVKMVNLHVQVCEKLFLNLKFNQCALIEGFKGFMKVGYKKKIQTRRVNRMLTLHKG